MKLTSRAGLLVFQFVRMVVAAAQEDIVLGCLTGVARQVTATAADAGAAAASPRAG